MKDNFFTLNYLELLCSLFSSSWTKESLRTTLSLNGVESEMLQIMLDLKCSVEKPFYSPACEMMMKKYHEIHSLLFLLFRGISGKDV